MRIRYAAPGIAVLMLGCVAVFGADSWRDKASSEWTADEVKKILNDSPWAQQVKLEMGQSGGHMSRGGGMGGPGGGGMGRGGGMGGPGGGMGGPGGGYGGGGGGWGGNRGGSRGGGEQGSGGGPRQVVVRWQSASPVQQALAKQSSAPATADAAAESEYVIAVSGLPDWSGRSRRNAEGDDSQQASGAPSEEDRRAAFLDRMKESSTLTPKGKSPFGPDKVERAADGTVLLYFPKAEEALSLNDREVEFASKMGPMELKYKFKLKDMTWQGKLAL